MLLDYLFKLKEWSHKRAILIFIVLLIILVLALQSWLQKPVQRERITYAINISSYPSKQLWSKDEFYSLMAANSSETVFLLSKISDNLLAIDSENGNTVWDIKLPFEQSGARGFLADKNTIFVITTLNVYAYQTETGKLKWSTRLGDGHVSIISQLDSDILRVYYGNEIYEIDSKTGEVLISYPKDDILWILGDIVIETSHPYGIRAFTKRTGEFLWEQKQSFFIEEGLVPQNLNKDVIFVWQKSASSLIKGICALDLKTGEYIWCRPEKFNSVMAVDSQSEYGYALREDNMLLIINLQTGDIVDERSFFFNKLPSLEMGTFASIAISDGNIIMSFIEKAGK